MEDQHLPDNVARQLDLEQEMATMGASAFKRAILSARMEGRESTTVYGTRLVRKAINPVANALVSFLAEADTGKPGPRHSAVRYLRDADPLKTAFIVTKALIDNIDSDTPLTSASMEIGRLIEYEMRFEKFEQANPGLFRVVLDDLHRRTPSREWQRKVLVHTMNKKGIDWEPWPERDLLLVGTKLIDLFIDATGFVQVSTYQTGKKRRTVLTSTETTAEFVESVIEKGEMLSPSLMPMVVPPRPWTTIDDGGYYTLPGATMVRPHFKVRQYLEEFAQRSDDMPAVYEAINILQDVPFKINLPVLEAAQAVWEGGIEAAGLPARENEALPPKPSDIDTNPEALTAWKRRASKVYETNAKATSKRIQTSRMLWLGHKFKDDARIYFPYHYDFRGRIYASPLFLNPQGPDLAKGLLTFANGKPIEDERAAGWLYIHGANMWGEDKVGLEDRIEWVQSHSDNILSCAEDPLANRWWMDADNPFQFLAFCFEYHGLLTEGYGYVSHLPIQLDGTCNGLQHFAAMVRDLASGEAVNLTPTERPQDIYQKVADLTVSKLELMPEDEEEYRSAWLNFGIDRKAAKRPVMVLPYGGTLYSCRKYIAEYLNERIAAGETNPFPDKEFEASRFLARVVWDAINEIVVAAQLVMKWLQTVARSAAKHDLPLLWKTPDGFPVLQAYPAMTARRIKTRLGESIIRPQLPTATSGLSLARQVNGVSPNFVHSMDAAAMRGYVTMAAHNGVDHFMVIHDSFATHAADTDLSAACIREAFVDMYQEVDVMQMFQTEVVDPLPDDVRESIPPVPEYGDLDLAAVKQATYFFS